MPASSAMATVSVLKMEPSSKVPPVSRSARRWIEPVGGPGGVGLGQRHGRQRSRPCRHRGPGRRPPAPSSGRGLLQLLGQRVLHADVERQPHRRPDRATGPLHRPRTWPALVEHALDARDAAVVGVDGAEHVPGERPQRIDALELGAEGEARQAQLVHALRLPRGSGRAPPRRSAGSCPPAPCAARPRRGRGGRLSASRSPRRDRGPAADRRRASAGPRRWRAGGRGGRRCRGATSCAPAARPARP